MNQNQTILQAFAALPPAALAVLGPITTEAENENALALLDELLAQVGPSDEHPLAPLVEVLIDRIAEFEEEHYPMPEAKPSAVLAYLMQEHGLSQAQLARAAGISPSSLSAVLRDKREISRGMARKLADHFHLDLAVFQP